MKLAEHRDMRIEHGDCAHAAKGNLQLWRLTESLGAA